jgi:hypothetical protein
VARIAGSRLKELVLTDTIRPTEAVRVAKNIRVVSIAPLIGEAIGRISQESSVSSLFETSAVTSVFAEAGLGQTSPMQNQKSHGAAQPRLRSGT